MANAGSPLAPKVELKGIQAIDDLNKLLEQLTPKLRKKVLRRAVRRSIAITRDDIKATAPIRQSGRVIAYRKGERRPKPGRLRRLVRIKARRGKRTYLKVSLFYPTEGAGNDPKNAFYWRFINDGFVNKWSGEWIPGTHYVIKSVDRTFNRVIRVMTGETRAGIAAELRALRRSSR